MSRNMIEANAGVFGALDSYCQVRSDPVRNAGGPRWIATNADDRAVLKQSRCEAVLSLTPGRSLLRVNLGRKVFFCTVGFEHALPQVGLDEIDVGAGLLTTILFEARPRPRATTTEVRNIVEAADKVSEPIYSGHDGALVASLFSPIRAFTALDVGPDETWRTFFLFCVDESRQGETWIEDEFADTLHTIGVLDPANIPYRTLCRSIFDSDQGAMFLALYRCLEALYAYSSAKKIMGALKLEENWTGVAAALEDQLGWYPREEGALTALLTTANRNDLEAIFAAFGTECPTRPDLASGAARLIYQLRNNLVHFRPMQHRLDYSAIDWNAVCIATATLVWHIYTVVFQ